MVRSCFLSPTAWLAALALVLTGCSASLPAVSDTPVPAPSEVGAEAGLSSPPAESSSIAPCTVTVEAGTDLASVTGSEPEGAVICLSSGLYDVSRTIAPKASQTIRGSKGAVLAGDVPVAGWHKVGQQWAAQGYLPADYDKAGQCEDERANPCRVAETFFLDDRPLRRVMSREEVDGTTFYADYQANVLYVGSSPDGHTTSLARTRTAISSTAAGVVLEGLTVKGFANLAQQGAIAVGGKGWTVRDSVVTANHGVGIMLVAAEDARITRNTITANGQMGVGQYRSPNGLIDNNRITKNNTAEFWRADWESGGIKVTKSSTKISNNDISDNLGVGVWIDEAGDGVSIVANRVTGNAACGIRYEISRNGIISGNVINGNSLALKRGAGTSLYTGAGITVNTSTDVTVENNSLSGNLNGIGIQARSRGAGPWGEYVLNHVVVKDNVVDLRSPDSSTTGFVVSHSIGEAPTSGAITFEGNRYVVTDKSAAKFNNQDKIVDFVAWQVAGNDPSGQLSGY